MKNERNGSTLLSTKALCKSYATQVLTDVDFELRAGEVHALVGENGAGKSTFAKIVCGITAPSSGSLTLGGKSYLPHSRRDAELHGARMVMQELNLISTLSVSENLYLSHIPRRFGFINYAAMNTEAKQVMQQVGLGEIDPSKPVGSLGIGQQQMVEIAANLIGHCRLLILDEPTAMLTDREIELLYAQINRLRDEGVGIIYISHRLEEIKQIADRITVLRDGKIVGTHQVKEVKIDDIVKMMVGREIGDQIDMGERQLGDTALRADSLSRGHVVRDVSFEVRQGEILGFAGLVGSGRTETMRLIFGADKLDSGQVFLNGKPVEITSPRQAVRHGIAMITEDRKGEGLLLTQSISINTTLANIPGVSTHGWINQRTEQDVAQKFGRTMSLKANSVNQNVNELSGGNQQKVIVARWLYPDCDVMLFDEPTRGIDVGAKFDIYNLLADLAAKGKAIVVVSSELRELMMICDRIAVMSAGKLVKFFDRDNWSQDAILSAAFSEYIDNTNTTRETAGI
jgi:ribose transport system ATP-binding protein